MRRKRARKSSASKNPVKRIKKNPAINLLDLPLEIIDLILSHIIPFPNEHYHAQGAGLSISRAFMAAITQTSQTLRQRSFDLIWKKCLWIKFKINSRKGVEMFAEDADFIPLMPPFLCSEFPLSTSFFQLEVGERRNRQHSIRQTRLFNDKMNTFIFPYNFDSLNRICAFVADLANSYRLGSLIITYSPQSKAPSDLLTNYIIPSITPVRQLDLVEFNLPDTYRPPVFTITKMLDESLRASDLLRAARKALEIADNYEAAGRTAEAGLKLLYSYWIIFEAELFLPRPKDWAQGEQEEDLDIDDIDYMLAPARNVIGNQLRQSVHEIEYRACLAFRKFYETRGIGWVMTHNRMFGAGSGRWVIEPPFSWFGLSTSELAQVHHAKAIAKRIQGEWNDIMYAIGLGLAWNSNKPLYNPNHNCPVAEEMYFATWLQSENTEYRKLYEEVAPKEGSRRKAFETLHSVRKFTDLGWTGDENMLTHWGGRLSLQYLSLARKGLEPEVVD